MILFLGRHALFLKKNSKTQEKTQLFFGEFWVLGKNHGRKVLEKKRGGVIYLLMGAEEGRGGRGRKGGGAPPLGTPGPSPGQSLWQGSRVIYAGPLKK
ncbi:MAG: hypothetical protein A2Z73_00020 [Deltaproteobacteria bacterium RBG_13_60_28]|nr:MAG: hypothetical protein A2Z73_00020 [Deltaproteobacteria bacterium RBG_13_60_28]